MIPPVFEITGHLSFGWPRQMNYIWHPRVGANELLDDSPALIEDLHQCAVMGQGANHEIAGLVALNTIAAAFASGNDPDPKPSRAFQDQPTSLTIPPAGIRPRIKHSMLFRGHSREFHR